MTTATKTFDCVRMKDQIQAAMLARYERHKGQYTSFEAFVRAEGRRSAWVQPINHKLPLRKRTTARQSELGCASPPPPEHRINPRTVLDSPA